MRAFYCGFAGHGWVAAKGKNGAAEGIRTPDPRITNAVLYRLSYRGAPTEWRFSNTRGLLTQGTSEANGRLAVVPRRH